MTDYKKQLEDLYAPISFLLLNNKLIEKNKNLHSQEISKYSTYNIITLSHSAVIYVGILFDNTRKSSSFLKIDQCIRNKKIQITEHKKWNLLFSSTYDSAKQIINLRNKFHAHKESEFDINDFWNKNPDEFEKLPLIAHNCKEMYDLLTQDLLGYLLDFDSLENKILSQFDIIFSNYDS